MALSACDDEIIHYPGEEKHMGERTINTKHGLATIFVPDDAEHQEGLKFLARMTTGRDDQEAIDQTLRGLVDSEAQGMNGAVAIDIDLEDQPNENGVLDGGMRIRKILTPDRLPSDLFDKVGRKSRGEDVQIPYPFNRLYDDEAGNEIHGNTFKDADTAFESIFGGQEQPQQRQSGMDQLGAILADVVGDIKRKSALRQMQEEFDKLEQAKAAHAVASQIHRRSLHGTEETGTLLTLCGIGAWLIFGHGFRATVGVGVLGYGITKLVAKKRAHRKAKKFFQEALESDD